MIFTVELHHAIGTNKFRLQTDGGLRNISKNISLANSDFVTDDPKVVTAKSNLRGKTVTIEGHPYDIDPGRWPTDNDQLHYSSLVFRKSFPEIPKKEQLIEIIAKGDDSHHNVLILNVNGLFELRGPGYNHLLNDPSVVIRHETYIAGNDYVGKTASLDKSFIDEEYISSLEYWLLHLKDHSTQHFTDLPHSRPLREILNDINSLKRSWRPEF